MSKYEMISSNEQFETLFNSDKLNLFIFSASWCGPCKSLQKQVESGDDLGVGIFKIDVDEFGDIAEKFGVSSIPSIFLIKNGVKVGHQMGSNYEALIELVEENK
jgi:thioredoxin 1